MHFPNANEFMAVFGWGMTTRQACFATGLTTGTVRAIAHKQGITMLNEPVEIPGLEHLPGLPHFATSRTWAGGTWYRIDCEQAADSPGYRSLLIHLSQQSADNAPELEPSHAEKDS